MNACTYTFTAAGEVMITCPGTNKIEIIIPGARRQSARKRSKASPTTPSGQVKPEKSQLKCS
jgi:hypothetical protein